MQSDIDYKIEKYRAKLAQYSKMKGGNPFKVGDYVQLPDGRIGKIDEIEKEIFTESAAIGSQFLNKNLIESVIDSHYDKIDKNLNDIQIGDFLLTNQPVQYNSRVHKVGMIFYKYKVLGNKYNEWELKISEKPLENKSKDKMIGKRVVESDSKMTGTIIDYHERYSYPHFIMQGDDGKKYDKNTSHFSLIN